MSEEMIELRANSTNLFNEVKVVVEGADPLYIYILVDNDGDEYDTRIKLGDKFYLGDDRWELREFLFVREGNGTSRCNEFDGEELLGRIYPAPRATEEPSFEFLTEFPA